MINPHFLCLPTAHHPIWMRRNSEPCPNSSFCPPWKPSLLHNHQNAGSSTSSFPSPPVYRSILRLPSFHRHGAWIHWIHRIEKLPWPMGFRHPMDVVPRGAREEQLREGLHGAMSEGSELCVCTLKRLRNAFAND